MVTRNVTTISVRELKAKASEILRQLEEADNLEVIITRHGKPCAKLVSLGKKRAEIPTLAKNQKEIPWSERISLRNTWAHLPMREPTDADFEEAKRIWEPRPIE